MSLLQGVCSNCCEKLCHLVRGDPYLGVLFLAGNCAEKTQILGANLKGGQ